MGKQKRQDAFDEIILELERKEDDEAAYRSILLKYARWNRLLGWFMILFGLGHFGFFIPFSIIELLPGAQTPYDFVSMIFYDIVITAICFFAVKYGIIKIKKNKIR